MWWKVLSDLCGRAAVEKSFSQSDFTVEKKQIYSRQEAGPISPSIRFPNTVSTIFFLQIQKPLLCRSHLQASYWYHNEIKGIKLALVLFCRCGSSLKKRRKDCCTGCQKVLISSYFPTGKQSKQKLPCADLLWNSLNSDYKGSFWKRKEEKAINAHKPCFHCLLSAKNLNS